MTSHIRFLQKSTWPKTVSFSTKKVFMPKKLLPWARKPLIKQQKTIYLTRLTPAWHLVKLSLPIPIMPLNPIRLCSLKFMRHSVNARACCLSKTQPANKQTVKWWLWSRLWQLNQPTSRGAKTSHISSLWWRRLTSLKAKRQHSLQLWRVKARCLCRISVNLFRTSRSSNLRIHKC